ncbi:MAG: molybdopterin molybdenumtransferase MoeA, partial [Myxococcales bacterium]|nr:molybdopterin molybdenumtransferase MoeA [Myxococcales bacterium]
MSDLSVEEGLARVLARYHVVEAETVAVEAAIGRVLAAAYAARWQLPSAPLSIMDGYAVRSADLRGEAAPVSLALMDESAAGHPSGALAPGSCIRIATGAVVPEGADAVVPQEDAMRHDDGAGDHTGPRVEFTTVAVEQVAPGRWIRPAGSDVAEGEALLDGGQLVGPGEASLLAAAGHHRI